MSRPAFQRRHYLMLADAIAATRALPHDSPAEQMADLVEYLSDKLAADNPEFSRDTFRRACDQEDARELHPRKRSCRLCREGARHLVCAR